EEALAGPKHDWVDHQAQLVHKVVLHQRVPELEAGGDEDFAIYLTLQLRDLVDHVAPYYRRVVPDGSIESRGNDVLGKAVQPVRERATSGWPPLSQELVAPPAQQKGLGAPRLVERNFGCLVATLSADKTDPAAAAEALDARRVLDDSVERDVLTDNNPCRCASLCRWSALGRSTSIRRFAQTSTRPPIGSQLDSLAGKAIREPDFRHLPYHSRITHSRHRAAIGGHHRTPSRSISYPRGRRGSLSDTGAHVPATVRDREAPGSNPGPPTNQLNSNFPDRARTWPRILMASRFSSLRN